MQSRWILKLELAHFASVQSSFEGFALQCASRISTGTNVLHNQSLHGHVGTRTRNNKPIDPRGDQKQFSLREFILTLSFSRITK